MLTEGKKRSSIPFLTSDDEKKTWSWGDEDNNPWTQTMYN